MLWTVRAKWLVLRNRNGKRRARRAGPDYGLVNAVGLPADLDLVEMLFTSLLVQAHRATQQLASTEAPRAAAGFRRGFLSAYAVRVGERLQAVRDRVEEELSAARGGDLVPTLEHRREAVDDTFGALFPQTRRLWASPVDGRGWRAGVAAADGADLGASARQGRLTG
jgi:hypothetical protein